MGTRVPRPIAVLPDSGRKLKSLGLIHKLTSEQTGGMIHLPKKIPQALQNPLKEPLRIMVHAIPGGLENYFDEVDAALHHGTFNTELHLEISRTSGLEWLERTHSLADQEVR